MALGLEDVTLSPFAPVVVEPAALSGHVSCGPESGLGAANTVDGLQRALRSRQRDLEQQVVGAFRATSKLDVLVRKTSADAERTRSPAARDATLARRDHLASQRQKSGGKAIALRARLERIKMAAKTAATDPNAAKAILACPIKVGVGKKASLNQRLTPGVPNARPGFVRGAMAPQTAYQPSSGMPQLPQLPSVPDADMMSRLGIPDGANNSRIRTWSLAKGLAEENALDGMGTAPVRTWMQGFHAAANAAAAQVRSGPLGEVPSWLNLPTTPASPTAPPAATSTPSWLKIPPSLTAGTSPTGGYSRTSPAPKEIGNAAQLVSDGGQLANSAEFIAFIRANPGEAAKIRANASATGSAVWSVVADAAEAIAAGGVPTTTMYDTTKAPAEKAPPTPTASGPSILTIGLGLLAAAGAAFAYSKR